MKAFLSTKEVAAFLKVNEKMVYSLVAEKRLPATKVTGKWLFPRHLVEEWLENSTINFPQEGTAKPVEDGLLIICGSNDILLEQAIGLFNRRYPDQIAVFGNLGSMGGLRALRRNLCHLATSHLLQTDENGYNFEFAHKELDRMPAVINFCMREQGLLIAKKNPKQIHSIADLSKPGVTIVNRPLGTGTRLLLDRELKRHGIAGDKIPGYTSEVSKHLDVGLAIVSGRADAGPGIRAVAGVLDLGFIPVRWERYDLMVAKHRFFDKGVQRFLNLIHETDFKELADAFTGYDIRQAGKMLFPEN